MNRKEISAVLASAGLKPRHEFGQNFMVDQVVLQAIAGAGEIGPEDVVLEVGPGVGNLTRLLSQLAPRGAIIAVDIDRKLMPAARRWHADLTNVHWLNADVLAGKHTVEPSVITKLRELRSLFPNGKLKLVSNLPYNAASPLVAELLVEMWKDTRKPKTESPNNPPINFTLLAFTVQWEVGLRMAAAPNTRDYGPLGILIQLMSDSVQIVRKIPAGAFWPPPKIASALVVIRPSTAKMQTIPDALALQELLQGIFSHRRQTLANGLKHYLGEAWETVLRNKITSAGFDLTTRAETLPPEDFLRLAALIPSPDSPPQL